MITMGMLIEVLGWIGTIVLIASFGGVSYGRIDGRSRAYQALNIVGGLLLAVNTAWHRAWPSVAMNIIWIGIAVGALAAGLTPRRAAPDEP